MEYLNIVVDLVKAIVEDKASVTHTITQDDIGVLLTIDCNHNEKGKIIGRDGQTANAIRSIARVIGRANNAHVSMKIVA